MLSDTKSFIHVWGWLPLIDFLCAFTRRNTLDVALVVVVIIVVEGTDASWGATIVWLDEVCELVEETLISPYTKLEI